MSTATATAQTSANLTSAVDHGTGGDLGRLVLRALRRETRRLDALFVNLALPVGIMVCVRLWHASARVEAKHLARDWIRMTKAVRPTAVGWTSRLGPQ
jgi:hypothetical protein